MSQKDGFAGGFLAGTIVGGIIGGVIGAVVASKISQTKDQEALEDNNDTLVDSDVSMEKARRKLESKIAQLNLAIDDVRQQMGSVNGNGFDESEDQ